jgi:hypothetical protein
VEYNSRRTGLTGRQISAIYFIENTLSVKCERPLNRQRGYAFLQNYLNKAKLKANGVNMSNVSKMTNQEAFELIFKYGSKSTSLT